MIVFVFKDIRIVMIFWGWLKSFYGINIRFIFEMERSNWFLLCDDNVLLLVNSVFCVLYFVILI